MDWVKKTIKYIDDEGGDKQQFIEGNEYGIRTDKETFLKGYINDGFKIDKNGSGSSSENISYNSTKRNNNYKNNNSTTGSKNINVAGNLVSGIGVSGVGLSTINGTFRLMKNGKFNPDYYSSGWSTGNQYVKNLYSVSKVGKGLSEGANIITTGIAYYQIYQGIQHPITYVDAGVGTIGIITSGVSYFSGVQIPFVGEFVAVYGVCRVTWDVFYYWGEKYGPDW